MPPPVKWTSQKRRKLRRLRTLGEPLAVCAKAVRFDYATVLKEARRLGIAGRMNVGLYPGRTVNRTRGLYMPRKNDPVLRAVIEAAKGALANADLPTIEGDQPRCEISEVSTREVQVFVDYPESPSRVFSIHITERR